MSLIRALSWPLITSPVEEDKQIVEGEAKNGSVNPAAAASAKKSNTKNGPIKKPAPTFQQLIAARHLICRRYYPESGWGWVIITVGVLINLLTHGLQLASFAFLAPAGVRFKVNDMEVNCLGELNNMNSARELKWDFKLFLTI